MSVISIAWHWQSLAVRNMQSRDRKAEKGFTFTKIVSTLCKTPYSQCSRMCSLFSPAIVSYYNRCVNVHARIRTDTKTFQQKSGRIFQTYILPLSGCSFQDIWGESKSATDKLP